MFVHDMIHTHFSPAHPLLPCTEGRIQHPIPSSDVKYISVLHYGSKMQHPIPVQTNRSINKCNLSPTHSNIPCWLWNLIYGRVAFQPCTEDQRWASNPKFRQWPVEPKIVLHYGSKCNIQSQFRPILYTLIRTLLWLLQYMHTCID